MSDKMRAEFDAFRDKRNADLEKEGLKPGSRYWIGNSHYAIWVASRAADKARIAELESDLGTVTKAAKELRAATPLLHCELFHHKRLDQHSSDAECPPFERWCVAALSVTEALAQQEKNHV
jgi:hypothetical protein